jgi:hypothetical protein
MKILVDPAQPKLPTVKRNIKNRSKHQKDAAVTVVASPVIYVHTNLLMPNRLSSFLEYRFGKSDMLQRTSLDYRHTIDTSKNACKASERRFVPFQSRRDRTDRPDGIADERLDNEFVYRVMLLTSASDNDTLEDVSAKSRATSTLFIFVVSMNERSTCKETEVNRNHSVSTVNETRNRLYLWPEPNIGKEACEMPKHTSDAFP